MNKKFIILRGAPGSGKSFKAKQLVGNTGVICSADNFFTVNGHYNFDVTKIKDAHKQCQNLALDALQNEVDTVIVDNTNTTITEMKSYIPHIKLAQKKGYSVEIIEADSEWAFNVDELYKRNTHNVPKQVIENMVKRYKKNVTVQDILEG